MSLSLSSFLLLSVALSMDTFTAGLSYSTDRVTVPFFSKAVIAVISGMMLALSLKAGSFFRSLISPDTAKLFSFLVLTALALYKLYDALPLSLRPKERFTTGSISRKVNRPDVHLLSASEAALLGVTLSLDSISAGLSTGIPALLPANPFILSAVVFLVSAVIHFAAISLGLFAGKLLIRKSSCRFTWLSAVLLFFLALTRLF